MVDSVKIEVRPTIQKCSALMVKKDFNWEFLLSLPGTKTLQTLAARSFGVNLNFVDYRGWLQGVPAGRFFNPSNQLSQSISAHDGGFKAKRDTAFKLASEISSIRLPKRFTTEVGTALVGVPLLVDGDYVGYIYADDFFDQEQFTDQKTRFESFVRRTLGESDLTNLDDIPVLTSADIGYLIDLMEVITDQVAGDQSESGGTRVASQDNRFQVSGFLNNYIVGGSKATKELVTMMARIASSDATVLVTGESGVGKELVAKTLHENSRRKGKDFVAVNCGAFHEHLLESELFGHIKGAFTGATENRIGYFERANGGTLFLDEIGETTLATQVKMLRFLQESTFMPVGSSKEKKSNVRVVAATNRDLKQMLKKARFREDLYYRLKVIQLVVPPLRDRKEDIKDLVQHFLEKHALDKSKTPVLESKTLEYLTQFHWPGNIRQLENEIKRLVVLGREDEKISHEHLSPEIIKSAKRRKELYQIDDRLKKTLEEREKKMIMEGLERTGGNKSKLARDLGMSRTVLANKIKKYEIA